MLRPRLYNQTSNCDKDNYFTNPLQFSDITCIKHVLSQDKNMYILAHEIKNLAFPLSC